MAKKKAGSELIMEATPSDGTGTQVRVLALPTPNIPAKVKQICDAMLLDSYRLGATFVYSDHLVLVFQ